MQNNTDIVVQDQVVLKAKQQLGTAFGCLPLSGITLFNGDPTYSDKIPDIIQTHRPIKQTGLPNFFRLMNSDSDSFECPVLQILSQGLF